MNGSNLLRTGPHSRLPSTQQRLFRGYKCKEFLGQADQFSREFLYLGNNSVLYFGFNLRILL